ncbi:hypothetical protein GF312_20275 [Candidatus Poribacteria bacterium]|nr:hypothetical protein [Candidatus Poribacteria bacterium]
MDITLCCCVFLSCAFIFSIDLGIINFDNINNIFGKHLPKDIIGNEIIKVYNLQGGEMACTIHNGSYELIGDAYNALMNWIEENSYEISGCAREVYLKGPEMGADPATFVTEVQIPVKKK